MTSTSEVSLIDIGLGGLSLQGGQAAEHRRHVHAQARMREENGLGPDAR